MQYRPYSRNQLERIAMELLVKYDKERLQKPKPLDPYAVIEACLGVLYDWKYLAPEQMILGATAFSDGFIEVWPQSKYYEGMKPYIIEVKKGTILIDASLTEGDNRGRENFTVMHEVFHQILHKYFFLDERKNGIHYSNMVDHTSRELQIIEWQANTCAAAFLMPAELVKREYEKRYRDAGILRYNFDFMWNLIRDMANDFNVSRVAMGYRLENLGLIDKYGENILQLK